MEEYAGWLVYLWTVGGNIETLVGISMLSLGAVLCVTTIVYFLSTGSYEENTREAAKNWINKLYKPFIALTLVLTFIPTKEQMLLIMAATPTAKTVVSSFEEGKIKKLDEILELGLDKALEKLKAE